MAFGWGIGKPRTRLGRFLDQEGVTQVWLEKKTGLSTPTITAICNDKNYEPTEKTKARIVTVLQHEEFDVYVEDFW